MPVQTYTEIINKREAEYVSTLSYEQFFKLFPPENKGDNGEWNNLDKKEYYSLVQLYIVKQIKNNFELEINYKPSDKNPTGRTYAKCAMALQRIHKPLREFLTKGLYYDYDMINCHFVIFKYLCDEAGLSTVYIKNYIENRPRILADNNACKTHILAKLNSDNARACGEWDKELKLLIKECNENKKVLYKKFVSQFQQSNEKNPISSIINKKMCEIENNILQEIITEFPDNKIVPCFDGFLIDEALDVDSLPDDICKWAEKPIETNVVVPDDFTFIPDAEVVNESDYEEMKKEFEKKHAKIIENSCFIMICDDGGVILKSRECIRTSYEHLTYDEWIDDKKSGGYYRKCSFINKWFTDPEIRRYDKMDSYPDANKCPPNVFNLWISFAAETWDCSKEINQQAVDDFLTHCLILCNHNKDVLEQVVLPCIAQMIQYPDLKSFVLNFISKPGGGKGTLIDILTKIFGSKKVLRTDKPLSDIFGSFNSAMSSAFLVILDEVKKSDMNSVQSQYKGLITEPTINIHSKGRDMYTIKSHHRFMSTSNDDDSFGS